MRALALRRLAAGQSEARRARAAIATKRQSEMALSDELSGGKCALDELGVNQKREKQMSV
jgi:hypothetical protein